MAALYENPREGRRVGKLNCWEYMKCGRQPGGENARRFGVCPAATDTLWDGVHRGEKGGRICWKIPQTHCHQFLKETSPETFAVKYQDCRMCNFYDHVRFEEPNDLFQNDSLMDGEL